MLPLIIVGGILAFLLAFFGIASSKRFEKRFFRIDSDNVTYVVGSIAFFVFAVYQTVNFDYFRAPSAMRVIIYFGISTFFISVSFYLIRKAISIAKRKAPK